MLKLLPRYFFRLRTAAFSVVVLAWALCFNACKKEDAVKTTHGNITLKVNIRHHDWSVHFFPVYLKNNATVWPGRDSSQYDLVAETGQDGTCIFSNLYVGDYYVYGAGYDPVVRMHVSGYAPVTLNTSTVVNNTAEITLYVSE